MGFWSRLVPAKKGFRRPNGQLPSNRELIRERDGRRCWLCGDRMHFNAPANSDLSPTEEHLVSRSRGGKDVMANTVLCHRKCNVLLGNRRKSEKEKMRRQMQAARREAWRGR
ncbi:HNH endonuclease [Sphingomicrobium flavum]|uniref:HNH endonuclease n=1 Tax=Sphingomicrobium flavum TaxID=1229164 RepID=UPI0021AE1B74|nr:HNH endonuclease [Sphingomicrobium flavum]